MGAAWGEADEDGVDLHDLARARGLQALRQAFGVARLADQAEAAAARLAAQRRHGRDHAALMRCFRMRPTVETEAAKPSRRNSQTSLRLAPHRVVGPELLDGLDQRRRPGRLAHRCGRRLLGSSAFSQR